MITEEFKQLRIATFRSVRPGEIVYFVPEGITVPPAVIGELADNPYNYTVRTATSPHRAFDYKAIIKEICLLEPQRVQMRVAPIPDGASVGASRAVGYLFSRSDDIFEPRAKRVEVMAGETSADSGIRASSIDFIGDEDDNGVWMASTKGFIDSQRDYDPDKTVEYELEDEHDEFLRKITDLSQQYAVRYHRIPPFGMIEQAVRGRLALSAEHLSPIVVTDDFRIRLPEFNDVEIKMPPLVRIVYLLFLLHPEGIRLKDIADHRQTLQRLYSLVKGRSDYSEVSDRHISGLTDLADPSSLNQKISRSRWCFDQHIMRSSLTGRYCITGERGETYRIDIPADLIRLPKSLIDLRNSNPIAKST